MKWKGSGSLNGNMRSISGDMEQGDDFDLSDIGQLIKGTREIIEVYL